MPAIDPTRSPASPGPVLVADIGGTTTRFAIAVPGGALRAVSIAVNDAAATFEAAIARYLEEQRVRPSAAVLAIAGPIGGDEIALTNRPWRFRLSSLKEIFGFRAVHAINDFEALAWAVVARRDCEILPLGSGGAGLDGAKVVLGPGTGLGVAGLVPLAQGGWHVVASEGGHISFGPADPDEDALFARLRQRHGPLSAETLLSGPGIERLYAALYGDKLASHDIVRGALANDGRARACVDLFVRLLGRFAGDAALMFKAVGGVYVAGGVAVGLKGFMDTAIFRAAFEAHPPYAELMARVPTFLVTCHEPGLLGCAAFAEQWLAANPI